MTEQWYCDRRAWARAVLAEEVWWGFKGLNNASPDARRKPQHNQLVQSMFYDEHFMNEYMANEVDWYATSDDFLGDWEEECEREINQTHCCTEENRCEDYKTDLAKRVEDSSARYQWACERVEWDWIRESIANSFDGDEGMWYGLKKHPVEAVYSRQREEWIDLEDVKGFCPSCNEPIQQIDIDRDIPQNATRVVPHPFSMGPCDCDDVDCLGPHMRCFFNQAAQCREYIRCPHCEFFDALDDLDESWIGRHGKPFNWPPGAPFPPRQLHDGFGLNANPKDDECEHP